MIRIVARFSSVLLIVSAAIAAAAEITPPTLSITGDWQIQATHNGTTAALNVSRPAMAVVKGEKYDRLQFLNPKVGPWAKGERFRGTRAMECTALKLLDPASVHLRNGQQPDAKEFVRGKDYDVDFVWATFWRLPQGAIGENQPVYVDYSYQQPRIDSIVLTADGKIELREGHPHVATPAQPDLASGERRLANVFLPGTIEKLTPDELFPITETEYPEPPREKPSKAERFLPKTMKKLLAGEKLRILAWGDSVTDGAYLADKSRERWQEQFVARLREKYPNAKIELVTEAWGGRNTSSYLAEPPGSIHNYKEKVLAAKPDLIISEFVNDAYMKPAQVEERYSKLLNDFNAIGAEWIILTPHYVRPDWMGLKIQRDIDADPRPYVAGLRQFTAKHNVALADAALRWGRLWRQGIPYNTLNTNTINHPNAMGLKLFADSLMAIFP